MKNTILIAIILCSLATLAIGAATSLSVDGDKRQIQGLSPDGAATATLTGPNITTDMSNRIAGSIYSSADCKVRYMNNGLTASRANFAQSTVPGGQYYTRVVNQKSPFWNISGCIGNIEQQ